MTQPPRRNGLTYRDSGVDIDAGNALVDRIKPLAAATARPGVEGGLGGFGALFDLRAAGYADPVLVAATDGVGTKLRLAIESGILAGVGVDLVAMCVNDLICQGAEPLFFLDYFAVGKLDVDQAAQVVEGIAKGCAESGCALIGGETAEMPGMYAPGDFDLAGFAVGAMERGGALPRPARPGDAILGVASSGVHSNGFSLVRRTLEAAGLTSADPAPFAPGLTLAEAFLVPTRLYVAAAKAARAAGEVRAFAHVTGGGWPENLPRALPEGLGAEIALPPPPPVFGWLQETAGIETGEMRRVFNCGVGLAAIVAASDAASVAAALRGAGETVFELGRVTDRPGVAVA